MISIVVIEWLLRIVLLGEEIGCLKGVDRLCKEMLVSFDSFLHCIFI